MRGYPTVFIDRMDRVNRFPYARVLAALRPFLLLAALFLALAALPPHLAYAQQTRFPSAKCGVVHLEAKTHGHIGDVNPADSGVDIIYSDTRVLADHGEDSSKTYHAPLTDPDK